MAHKLLLRKEIREVGGRRQGVGASVPIPIVWQKANFLVRGQALDAAGYGASQ